VVAGQEATLASLLALLEVLTKVLVEAVLLVPVRLVLVRLVALES
jgi:hypothetical protein